MLSTIKKVALGLALAAMVAPAAQAAGAMGHAALTAGVAFGSNSFGPRFPIGVEAGYKFSPEFGANVNFSFSTKDGGKYLPLGVEGNYYFPGMPVYAGINLGFELESSKLFLGAQVGADFEVADSLSVGVKVPFNYILTDVSKTMVFSVLGNVSFWF